MNTAETAILAFFRRFEARPAEMLFINPQQSKDQSAKFRTAMQSLIDKGFVTKERPKQAYSLTVAGYRASVGVAVKV